MSQIQSEVPTLETLAILVNPKSDHVAVAKQTIPAGTRLSCPDGSVVTLRAEIPPGHRFAIRPVPGGEWVLPVWAALRRFARVCSPATR